MRPSVSHISRTMSSPLGLVFSSPLSWFFFRRASLWPMMRFTCANLRVFFCIPIWITACSPVEGRIRNLSVGSEISETLSGEKGYPAGLNLASDMQRHARRFAAVNRHSSAAYPLHSSSKHPCPGTAPNTSADSVMSRQCPQSRLCGSLFDRYADHLSLPFDN